MNKKNARLANLAAVLVSPDVVKTAEYYHNIMGFRMVKNFRCREKFAALYRDNVEIIIVQSKHGKVQSNRQKYGAGYDVYITPDTVEGVDLIYSELRDKGAKIISVPQMTDYGSYEFVVGDIDGRLIGIGQIKNKERFFKNSSM